MSLIIKSETINLQTRGNIDIHDITDKLQQFVKESQIKEGILTAIIPGSTGSITTLEFEPGLVEDLKSFIEKFIQQDIPYLHNKLNYDDNGHSHLRSTIFGTSISIPIRKSGKLVLGTYQQVIFIDFDTHARNRSIEVQVVGKS